MAANIGEYIECTPEILGGRPRLSGTRISVRSIVGWYKKGYSPEEISDQFERPAAELLPKVYAALSYYHANKDKIEADVQAENAAYKNARLASEKNHQNTL